MSDLERLLELLREFTAEREWAKFHDPKNLSMLLASEVGELLALLRWVDGADSDAWVRGEANRKALEDEVADVAIALLLFCDRAGVDLRAVVQRKIETNRRNYPADVVRGSAARPARGEE